MAWLSRHKDRLSACFEKLVSGIKHCWGCRDIIGTVLAHEGILISSWYRIDSWILAAYQQYKQLSDNDSEAINMRAGNSVRSPRLLMVCQYRHSPLQLPYNSFSSFFDKIKMSCSMIWYSFIGTLITIYLVGRVGYILSLYNKARKLSERHRLESGCTVI